MSGCRSRYWVDPAQLSYLLDSAMIHDQMLNILIAGRDGVSPAPSLNVRVILTSMQVAMTLTFATYFLCMYSDVLHRLRAEVLQHVGPKRCPTYDDIKNMKYLRAFINGAQRPSWPPSLSLNVMYRDLTTLSSSVSGSSFPPSYPMLLLIHNTSPFDMRCVYRSSLDAPF